jgi:predicted secreted Zn-dependent protease
MPVAAASNTETHFGDTWAHDDQPVAAGQVNRTWMWGPSADGAPLSESYAQSPNNQREVQYFDKTRMEITHPNGDASSIWYVTNGLLAKELITGQMQTGDNTFETRQPARINVAGDAGDPNGPTYATFNSLMNAGATPNGWTIIQTVDRSGNIGSDQNLGSFGVTAVDVGSPTKHTVASIFWGFMNSSGTVYQNGNYVASKLFDNPFYATGYPLTEPYWTNVLVGGVQKQVLVQVFERRVLTYTPSNPDGWKVEAGNVGQHYYQWRYGKPALPQSTVSNPSEVQNVASHSNGNVVQDPAPTPTTIGSLTFQHATFQYYEVHGSTADELRAGMAQAGPHGSGGAEFAANTSWQFHWSWNQSTSGGVCHPTNVQITYSITIEFPHWAPPADAVPGLVDRWTAFTQSLATHEDGHAVRVIQNAGTVADAISAASCANASAAAQSALNSIQQINDQYDIDTNHGATQGAVWP